MRLLILVTLFAWNCPALAQSPDAPEDTTALGWEFETSLYYYVLPQDEVTPLVYADYKSLHLEARYNYEDKNTASVFAGRRFETGDKCVLGVTPIAGFVFGNTKGFAPGLLVDVAYGKFDFYSESEYLLDNSGSENNYFYTWTELAISPTDKFRTGLSASRTRLVESDLDLQRGVFVQYSFGNFTGGLHYFNPFTDSYYFIATLSYAF